MFEEAGDFIQEYYPLFILLVLLFLPTGLHFLLINNGYNSPFFIEQLAINNWFKAIVGLTVGIALGFFVTKKFGD